ncbi:(Fe-S)-binding protein [Zhouia sp. PK063]|uniref:(Fe-S)-binding protein n=1 Tax=Zhouia sp. PK063 TaxID=3373602 RepID=UPI0037A90CBA
MKVGLFIPCYVNQFYPQVGIASYNLLTSLGVEVSYPLGQTCCGQPMANSGYACDAAETEKHFVSLFKDADYIVSPSGSCTAQVREHFNEIEQNDVVQKVKNNTYEICEFLYKILKMERVTTAYFPHKVALHQSCHGLRGLRLGPCSEKMQSFTPIVQNYLENVKGMELIKPKRSDECCGFGGTFAVTEEAVSVKMGNDRVLDYLANGAEVITATDMSCLMHLEGLIKRNNYPLKIKHITEILTGKN